MTQWMHFETQSGNPVTVKGTTLTPFSQALRIQIPGLNGGLVWNRPVSVLAVSPDGQEQVIPIPDITRMIQLGLLGVSLLAAILFGLILGKKR